MTVRIEGHECMLFGDRDRSVLPELSFRGKVRWFELRVRQFLLDPIEKLRPKRRGRTESELGSLLAFGTLLCSGIEALGSFHAGKEGTSATFSSFVLAFMDSSLHPHTRELRDDFRNGLAHGLYVKRGGFEYDLGGLVRTRPRAGVQLDPDALMIEFRLAVRRYIAQLRGSGPGSDIGRRFLARFAQAFEG